MESLNVENTLWMNTVIASGCFFLFPSFTFSHSFISCCCSHSFLFANSYTILTDLFFFRDIGTVIGLVIYTGRETRSVMNTSTPKTKVGLLDHELNRLSKVTLSLLVSYKTNSNSSIRLILFVLNSSRVHYLDCVLYFRCCFSCWSVWHSYSLLLIVSTGRGGSLSFVSSSCSLQSFQ